MKDLDNNNYDSSDYLTYKKSKMNPQRAQRVEKRVEKVKRIAKMSFLTFCVMFLCVVIFIKKYAKKIDIEYGRNAAGQTQQQKNGDNFDLSVDNSDKRPIDNRLLLIQQEENAPSESKVLPQDRDKNEVINFEHYEMLKAGMEDGETFKNQDTSPSRPSTASSKSSQSAKTTVLLPKMQVTNSSPDAAPQGSYEPRPISDTQAVTKVFSGRYSTFDEAKSAQSAIQDMRPSLVPFIRRVGGVYTLQLGSYTNSDVARSVANSLRSEGIDAWVH